MCFYPGSLHSFDLKQVATAPEAETVKGDGQTEALAPSLAEKFEIPTNTEVMVLSQCKALIFISGCLLYLV